MLLPRTGIALSERRAASMTAKKKMKFEEALERLEKIVTRLEDGEISLDDSLTLFQEGRKLSKECAEQLAEVETKARILLEQADGAVTESPFALGDSEDESETEDEGPEA